MTRTLSDADLDDGLDEAKKKPRYFAIITKGAQKIVKIIVQKKRVLEGDILSARSEFDGNASITGVCTRNGQQLILQVTDKEPALQPVKIKQFITEQTGATVKPEWRVVAALTAVPDDDFGDVPPATKKEHVALDPAILGRAPPEVRAKPVEVDYEDVDLSKPKSAAPQSGGQNDPNANFSAPPAKPLASSSDDDHYADVDLRKSSDAKDPRADAAPVSPQAQAQPVVQSPPSSDDDHYSNAELEQSGKVQSPRTDQSAVTPPPQVQPVVQPPPVAQPQASAAPNTKKEKVRAALEKARPKINLAIEKTEKDKPEKPISKLLARIEELLDDTTGDQSDLAMSEFRALVALISPLLEDRGALPEAKQSKRQVQLQQCRYLWETTRKKLHEKLQGLAASVETECQNPDEYDLADVKKKLKVELIDHVMDRLDKRLIDVLDQALNAEKREVRSAFEKQAVQLVAEYLEFVDTNPLVAQIDDNGLIDTKIKPTLTSVLGELSNRLSA
jgi:hypothetical protein